MYSGTTRLTVREAIQPRALHRIQASGILTSGSFNTEPYYTRPFKQCFILTNISQVSGTNTALDLQLQTSPDNVIWYPQSNIRQKTATSAYYDLVSGYLSEYTRFRFEVVTSGGCWTQIDANFIR